MANYLNLGVVLRYDFVVTYLVVMLFIYWIRTIFHLKRLNYVFWRVWESRNTLIHRRKSCPTQNQGISSIPRKDPYEHSNLQD